MGSVPDQQVTFRKFVREVCRFAPAELLAAVAREGCVQTLRHRQSPHLLLDGASPVTPWALAEIARESIVYGAQQGQAPPSVLGLWRLCTLYANLDDPLSEGPDASIDQFFVRIGFEQFRWQLSEFEELARPHALLIEAALSVPQAAAFSEDRWRAALGCSVEEFLRVGFFLFVWASQHDGWVDLEWMNLPHFKKQVWDHCPPELIQHVADNLLGADMAHLRKIDGITTSSRAVHEHRFNPLVSRPLVRMRDGRFLAPHPMLILHRLGVSGLYYDRVGERGFSDQLGPVFEGYVGMHLRLLQNARVEHSIMATPADEIIDYVVVLPDVVLLVEVKATRLTHDARMGLDQLSLDRDRTLGKAYKQIARAEGLILGGDPALSFVPVDRPRRGIVVTLEPYWNAVSGFAALPPPPPIPTTVAHIREIEFLAAAGLVNDVGKSLLVLTGEHSNHAVHDAVESLDCARNPILDRAWAASVGLVA
jgi:hypothetical protein